MTAPHDGHEKHAPDNPVANPASPEPVLGTPPTPGKAFDRDGDAPMENIAEGAAEEMHAEHAGHHPDVPADGVATDAAPMEHADHAAHTMPDAHAGHRAMNGQPADAHAGHGAAHVDHSGHEMMFRHRFWISLLLTIPVLLYSPMLQMWFGFTAPPFPGSQWAPVLFAGIIFAYGGVPFLQMAVPEIRARKPGMMTLISLAITVALSYSVAAIWIDPTGGFLWEMALLIDVMLLGHWIEMRSVRQASGALGELAKLMPDTAERLDAGGNVETVPVAELRLDDLLLVRPGAAVPADGEVVEGQSQVDEAMITGESRAVSKETGSRVIAGTVNGDGSLRVRVRAVGQETALAGIMRLVEEAQNSKSATQVLADKASGWLFYIALAVAIITAIVWVLATGFNVAILERVATVLVIACPHALGLAVPLVVAISTSMAARNGVLVRSRIALEEARLVDTVIFDKTGTLTEGKQGVVGLDVVEGWSEERALAVAAAVEGDSEHIVAKAIRTAAAARKVEIPVVSDFAAIKGRGAQAMVDGAQVYIGGPRLLEMLDAELPAALAGFMQTAEGRGQAVIHLVVDGAPVAAFALADVVRKESKAAVDRLHKMGIEVVMLTGDSKAVAAAVAQELGIDRFFAEVLPENKDRAVSELQAQGKKVAMVGDGVNDAPALTRADVGIAIGSGTDVAVESADIILVQSNPMDVTKIFKLSRATRSKMAQNLWWAAGYNIFALPLAAGILAPWGFILSPAMGALLMSVSTVVVALNAQLLRRVQLA